MKPTYQRGPIRLYRADCRDVLGSVADQVDAIITDPPYGIAYDASHAKYKNGIARDAADWDVKPYDPAPILDLAKPSIIWGGNCFSSRLPASSIWIAWVKTRRDHADIRQADMELAWTNCLGRPRVFHHLWIGAFKDSERGDINIHPTQKPVALMRFCMDCLRLKRLGMTDGGTILDPYIGSGTTAIAGIREGFDVIGIERDPDHFDRAVARIDEELDAGDFLSGATTAGNRESARLFD